MKETAIINYGSGNIFSLTNALDHVGVANVLVSTPEELDRYDQMILPGVGAFSDCMDKLHEKQFTSAIQTFVEAGKKTLGICVGMQMLFDKSFEFGESQGFGFLPGNVEKIPTVNAKNMPITVPHVGWRKIEICEVTSGITGVGQVFAQLDASHEYYFVHSFSAKPEIHTDLIANANYNGVSIAAAAGRDHLLGLQFHPEKSGEAGLELLKRWAEF
jgi:glutamine amidotransferase